MRNFGFWIWGCGFGLVLVEVGCVSLAFCSFRAILVDLRSFCVRDGFGEKGGGIGGGVPLSKSGLDGRGRME